MPYIDLNDFCTGNNGTKEANPWNGSNIKPCSLSEKNVSQHELV